MMPARSTCAVVLGEDRRPMDAIELQILSGALRSACEEMGAVLIRCAHSANIKERRDASTALFAPSGEMVMQAEHIPVHLGAMPAAVAEVAGREQAPGRSWILNDPYRGGTHLPDITVITPVFADTRPPELLGFAASRAHHADVGGPTPGSMPADSRTLAAGRVGVRAMRELAGRLGVGTLLAAYDEVLDYAERRTRACLEALPDGSRRAVDRLEAPEGDLRIELVATVHGDSLTLDFTGTAPAHDGNLNCPLAVTTSAAYFAVRVLTDPDIPANAGAQRPVRVIAPEGSLLHAMPHPVDPSASPAVAAGNVETSSRVADVILAAFGRALGQGTMNNLTLGDEHGVVYYETIAGGQGACPDADGPDAVHVAMSNTLNTPVEALELEFPLRVTRYALRRGSGGAGRHRGGDGVIRELEALSPLSFSLITERRRHPPPGAAGGSPGARGRNLLDGSELPPKCVGTLAAGQRLRIETPGGGGHGAEDERTPKAPL